MAVRIRKNGRILCAALNCKEDGDTYLDDNIHYILSVEYKILITTENKHHMKNGGEWWWRGLQPNNIIIDKFYNHGIKTQIKESQDKA